MAKILDGKAVSASVKEQVANETAALKEKGITPGLAVVIVGDDPASHVYVNNKKKACAQVGFHSEEYALPAQTTQEELLALVETLNKKPDINGILVQLPLPPHLDEKAVIEAIDPKKDVDAFHASNVGKIMIGDYHFLPCTPAGVMELLKSEKIDVCSKNCVVIGRSNIVGKPMATLMMQKSYTGDCTVTVCHSRSKNLKEMCLSADIIIVALGVPEFLKGNMVKEGAVIVDVGTTRMPSSITKSGFKLTGDVLFNEVAPKCSYITPVPGGVGPMTIISLMRNTLLAGKKAIYK